MKYIYAILLPIISIVLVVTSCATQRGDFMVVCEINSVNNYDIKWEVEGNRDEALKVFRLRTPFFTKSDLRTPDFIISMQEGRVTVPNDRKTRSYFCLEFNDGFREVVSTRHQYFPGVRRSRDIGGYRTASGEQVRWGMVYPTSDVRLVNPLGIERLKMLGIKSLVNMDFGAKDGSFSEDLPFRNYYFYETETKGFTEVALKLNQNTITRDDAVEYVQGAVENLMARESHQLSKIFRLFAHAENYPIMLSSSILKDKSEFVISVLLSFLGVSDETIVEDYLLNNVNRPIEEHKALTATLSPGGQEAVTYMLSADEASIKRMMRGMKRQFGSAESYLREELKLSESELSAIRKQMLYTL